MLNSAGIIKYLMLMVKRYCKRVKNSWCKQQVGLLSVERPLQYYSKKAFMRSTDY